ncbi:hypothetical protein COLO4_16024 [Corchorus olitorius]|uniref:Uncharacterized protein n=1 Tax=Corchorus olitorius TaxID=93759 RepID=A0A1R3JK41_9ROSI|nr:hypothetical protein COLO4_37427 [Corchorus olitorius]OMO95226.1 hypothetical protein COLO4_16024 [Corchorus olitorius]
MDNNLHIRSNPTGANAAMCQDCGFGQEAIALARTSTSLWQFERKQRGMAVL